MEITYSIEELPGAAARLIKSVPSNILLFQGTLGAGKTTLIKEIARQLGYTDTASSPSFSLINEYHTGTETFYHYDFYRLKDETEALDLGIEEYFSYPGWHFVEWPEKIEGLLPQGAVNICLSIEEDGKRRLVMG